jgi:hypothetical protein
MTEDNIPVPAESIRQLAISAAEEVAKHREAGRKASAQRLERHISEAFDAVRGKDGEFVSINEMAVSSLAAEGCIDTFDHADAAEVYLEKYGVWSGE